MNQATSKTTSKHTPGPWLWTKQYPTGDGRETYSLVCGRNDNVHGILSCDGVENSPQRCNPPDARLIAASPDLLAACEANAAWAWAEHNHKSSTFQERVDLCHYAEHLTLVALSKALGSQGPGNYEGLLRIYMNGSSYRPTTADTQDVVDRIIGEYRAAIARAEGGVA